MITHKKSGIIKYTSIKKKDLRDLTEKIILEKNPLDNYNALISTNIDTLCIDEKSIEAFLAHVEVPDLLSNYRVEYCDQMRYIDLDVRNLQPFLFVSGSDEAWVLGKFQQIEKFLNSKLDEYNEEQKRLDRNETIELKVDKIVIPESILRKFEKRKPSELAMLILTILLLVIGILQLISMWK